MRPFSIRHSVGFGVALALLTAPLVFAETGDPNERARPVVEHTAAESSADRAIGDEAATLSTRGAAGLDIRIDISNFQSTTPGNWNNIDAIGGLTTNLIDFTSGAGTGVSIDGSGSPWSPFFGDVDGTFPNQDWLIQPATGDGAGLQIGESGSFVIAGLPAGSYQVEVVSARTSFGYLNTFTVNGALADRTFLGSAVLTPWNSADDGLGPGNWLIWDDVVPAGGVITITDDADPSTLGIINAIRILEAPTPITEIPTLSEWGAIGFTLALFLAAVVLLRRRLS